MEKVLAQKMVRFVDDFFETSGRKRLLHQAAVLAVLEFEQHKRCAGQVQMRQDFGFTAFDVDLYDVGRGDACRVDHIDLECRLHDGGAERVNGV